MWSGTIGLAVRNQHLLWDHSLTHLTHFTHARASLHSLNCFRPSGSFTLLSISLFQSESVLPCRKLAIASPIRTPATRRLTEKQRCFDDLRVDEESLLEKEEWDDSFCSIIDEDDQDEEWWKAEAEEAKDLGTKWQAPPPEGTAEAEAKDLGTTTDKKKKQQRQEEEAEPDDEEQNMARRQISEEAKAGEAEDDAAKQAEAEAEEEAEAQKTWYDEWEEDKQWEENDWHGAAAAEAEAQETWDNEEYDAEDRWQHVSGV